MMMAEYSDDLRSVLGAAYGEETLCARCNKSAVRGRLLRCLHNICNACLQELVQTEAIMTCPRCRRQTPAPIPGTGQVQGLPKAYNTSTGSSEDDAELAGVCDECADSEDGAARSVCLDCGTNLCEDHAMIHTKSRGTKDHSVVLIADDVEGGGRRARQTENCMCAIHPSMKLNFFCMDSDCNVLLCERCKDQGAHAKGGHSVVTVRDAAAQHRRELTEKRRISKSSRGQADPNTRNDRSTEQRLVESLRTVTRMMQDLHARIQAVSEDVTSEFNTLERLMETIKSRQDELLQQLDSAREERMQPLVLQQERLRRCLAGALQVDILLERCAGEENDRDFLRMAQWLRESIEELDERLEKDRNPLVSSYAVFNPVCFTEFKATALALGEVSDMALDETQSSVSLSHNVTSVKDALRITIDAKNSQGTPVAAEHVEKMEVEVFVESDVIQRAGCKLSQCSPLGQLEAKFQPTIPGKYKVSAVIHGRHLQHSPVIVDIKQHLMTFNPAVCGQHIQLSNNNTTARIRDDRTGMVFSTECFPPGKSETRIQVDSLLNNYASIFVSNDDTAAINLDSSPAGQQKYIGWTTNNSNSLDANSSNFTARIQAGDVISVRVDTESLTATFTNLRARVGQTLPLAEGEHRLVFCKSPYSSNSSTYSQVTLIH